MKLLAEFAILLLVSWSLGCQTTRSQTPTMVQPDYDEASHAAGEAYAGDAMNFRKPMPSHSDWRPMDFYFKHCSEIGDATYFSKTSYECSSP